MHRSHAREISRARSAAAPSRRRAPAGRTSLVRSDVSPMVKAISLTVRRSHHLQPPSPPGTPPALQHPSIALPTRSTRACLLAIGRRAAVSRPAHCLAQAEARAEQARPLGAAADAVLRDGGMASGSNDNPGVLCAWERMCGPRRPLPAGTNQVTERVEVCESEADFGLNVRKCAYTKDI